MSQNTVLQNVHKYKDPPIRPCYMNDENTDESFFLLIPTQTYI